MNQHRSPASSIGGGGHRGSNGSSNGRSLNSVANDIDSCSDTEPLLLEDFSSGIGNHLDFSTAAESTKHSSTGQNNLDSFEYRWLAADQVAFQAVTQASPFDNSVEHKQQHVRHPVNTVSYSSEEQRMTLEQSICEDLRAFETRLTELVSELHPPTRRWRLLLALATLLMLTGAIQVLIDEEAYPREPLLSTGLRHPLFTGSLLLLLTLFCPPVAIHRRIIAPAIIRSRIQEVIGQFNMSCDDRGRLILMPHPRFLKNDQKDAAEEVAAYQQQQQQLEEQERQRRRAATGGISIRWS